MGMSQPLKIAAQRKIFHHLSSSAFPPHGAIEAMVKCSEEIGLQVQYRRPFPFERRMVFATDSSTDSHTPVAKTIVSSDVLFASSLRACA